MKITTTGIQFGEELIGWERVEQVAIRTTADGPFGEDLFWMIGLADGLVELPSMLVDGEGMHAMQDALPGFDNLKCILAMGSTDERIFTIWSRARAWREVVTTERFSGLVTRLGGKADADVYEKLTNAWCGEQRRYHNLEHLADCLCELDAAGGADIVELALWYHDVIYTAGAHDNEERSAQRLLDDAALLGVDADTTRAAADLIRATAHLDGGRATTPAAELIVDIDLAILGREPLRFMDFEYAVAEEYASVPRALFFRGRRKFLESLLASPSIYRTEAFHARYEATARTNITRLLGSPRYRPTGLMGMLGRLFA